MTYTLLNPDTHNVIDSILSTKAGGLGDVLRHQWDQDQSWVVVGFQCLGLGFDMGCDRICLFSGVYIF